MAETAIVVIVPEGEPVVGRWQREHTRAGADGMPPHVTLVIPFADSESLPLAEVGEVLGEVTPFAFALTELRRFAGRPLSSSGSRPNRQLRFAARPDRARDRARAADRGQG